MKTYTCDACGYAVSSPKIVGHEFDYKGFKTLTFTHNGINDVCGTCWSKISARDKDDIKRRAETKFDVAISVLNEIKPYEGPKALSWWRRLFPSHGR